MVVLSFLTVGAIVFDYIALTCYTNDMQATINFREKTKLQYYLLSNDLLDALEFRLPLYLAMKLTLTPLVSHIYSTQLLKRFFVPKSLTYSLISLFGLAVLEFTAFDSLPAANSSYTVYLTLIGRLKLVVPSIYTFNTFGNTWKQEIMVQQWLPFILVSLSCIFNGLVPVLSKAYVIRASHSLKL
jgi:hypothetical protein